MDDLLDEMSGDAESSLDLPQDGELGSVAKIAEQIIAQENQKLDIYRLSI